MTEAVVADMSTAARPDIVIIGGGVIGSAAAYFLTKDGRAGRVIVLEPDPLYIRAATPRASGGARRLFSRPENILMSNFSISFYQRFAEHCSVDGEAPEIGFRCDGYLFIVPPEGVTTLESNYALQTSLGVEVHLLDRDALRRRLPSMHVEDVGAAAYAPKDGCLEPNGALQGFRRKARAQGAEYLAERVVDLAVHGTAVREVHLASGRVLRPRTVICAAGTWSAQVAAMAGMHLPVEPMQRHDHFWMCRAEIEQLPFVKDLNGLGFHPWDRGYTGSVVDFAIPGGHNWDVDHGYFERVVWPAIAHRVPAMEELRLCDSWVGHYDRNTLDGNMILGNWPGRLDNFYVACGFTGHGLMHAPAVGRALGELILDGGFQTIDLTRMGYQRVLDNEPYAEAGIR